MRRLWPALLVLAAGCATTADRPDYASVPRWTTRATPEARGDVRVQPDGRRVAVRYPGWTTRDYSGFRTYAYDDTRAEPPVQRATMPPGVTGDATRGRALFLDRNRGPCTGCHLVPGEDVWPAGSVGPDLSTLADRKLPDAYLYQHLWDPRVTFPQTVMPPWGAQGALTPEEIVHLVAYLQDVQSVERVSALPDGAYRFPMEAGQPDFVWADEQGATGVIRNCADRLYVALNWRHGFTDDVPDAARAAEGGDPSRSRARGAAHVPQRRDEATSAVHAAGDRVGVSGRGGTSEPDHPAPAEQRIEIAAGRNDLEVRLRLEQTPDTLANEVVVFRQHEAYRHRDQHMTAPPSRP